MDNCIASSPITKANTSQHETECLALLTQHIDPDAARILASAMHLAPYLDKLYRNHLTLLPPIIADDHNNLANVTTIIGEINAQLSDDFDSATTNDHAMRAIRLFRQKINVVVTVLDLLDRASVARQMAWLSAAADLASTTLAHWLETRARQMKRLEPAASWSIIAMGKLGSSELNFSSDIDLIILYACAENDVESGRVYIDLARQFATIMSQPTADGIGWRVDYRLRPNPSVTPVAIKLDNAISYYESIARTWERVAFIRARPFAGSIPLAEQFLSEIDLFIWRRYLDYTVIDEMKMMLQREPKQQDLFGFNIKKGNGGIRSIEFAVHVQQIIAGGREPELRQSSTIEALTALGKSNWINTASAKILSDHYYQLRRLEHRIQMINDAHSHQFPRHNEALSDLAQFCGYQDIATFRQAVHALTDSVISHTETIAKKLGAKPPDADRTHPISLFLLLDQDDDSNAVTNTLSDLGFIEIDSITSTCRRWMAGDIPATQTSRSKAILGRLLPEILTQIGKAEHPDKAFHAFARLVENLPIGVQFFSLLESNPNITKVIANLLIASPRMAENLATHSALIDDLLYEEFWHPIDLNIDSMVDVLSSCMAASRSYEDKLNQLRITLRHWHFRSHAHLISGIVEPFEMATILSHIAEAAIIAALPIAKDHIDARYGTIETGSLAIMAMGRLGTREMTSSSDLDLVFIHHSPSDSETPIMTNGDHPIHANYYFIRIGQELINVLTAQTAEGRAYEVDMRLRPSGKSGPVTVAFDRFANYQQEQAWTWEHMALVRARIITGFNHENLTHNFETCLKTLFQMPRDNDKVIRDAHEMRQRITTYHPPRSAHDLRLIPGGLIDIDFFAQVMQLITPRSDGRRYGRASDAITDLAKRRIITAKDEKALKTSISVLLNLNQIMQLVLISLHDQNPDAWLPQPITERFSIKTIAKMDSMVKIHTETILAITAKYLNLSH
ncbi:MAG: bifunctional glutamine synthetase adenylyltransferase/deadenyltransferase [Candidatus Puniceispirillum sp. TMED52]|nr:bifunctional [glutamate--ammonia ligase]-adenylyl-L-tyrosine phosphorylase/[glutamate--ammonia-ligase] adenylyltransferase [SAR116 cluster bacterium]OUU53921.1 MAG: bifunctional glutamine synthetase adenylyltransferase/deadenyltransferase [Candidatus Puniceispirillum sp. TMED52]HCP19476.1 bifunctional [glutamate--ammonia ligase]-adenylyl-L-tyrosine phosphorylase/[glutamate--ammonia-ligase] adenylyltransferase [Alphaproteobacteria bacterium]